MSGHYIALHCIALRHSVEHRPDDVVGRTNGAAWRVLIARGIDMALVYVVSIRIHGTDLLLMELLLVQYCREKLREALQP